MIRAIIAFLASVVTAAQVFFLSTDGKSFCFNDGCAIVDSMTIFPPLVFNIAGFVYFQLLFWALLVGRKGSEHWHKLAGLLLLAGLGAEAVLVFFQYSIATVFCSYCLVIFALVVVLNLLSGLRQLFRGAVVFAAVTLACFSLQFSGGSASGLSLDSGTLARVEGEREGVEHYLFFSATCGHCEQVIEYLAEENLCDVRFNPVEPIEGFRFDGAKFEGEYDPSVNFNFMKSLSITEIPVLVAKNGQETRIIKGRQRIELYLDEMCRTTVETDYSGGTGMSLSGYNFLPGSVNQKEDACAVSVECTAEESGNVSGRQ